MKNLWGIALVLVLTGGYVAAQTINNELEDNLGANTLDMQLEFEQVTSCDALTDRIDDWLEEHKESFQRPYYRRDTVDMVMEESIAQDGIANSDAAKSPNIGSTHTDFSTTNVQKSGIDEPDIYKTDGNILYYYSASKSMIYLIQSPLDRVNATITLDDAIVLSQIRLPDSISQAQLYLHNDELIIVGVRYRNQQKARGRFDNHSQTILARYDVTDATTPSLTAYDQYDGWLMDSRLDIEQGVVMVMTQISPSYGARPLTADDIALPRSVSVRPAVGRFDVQIDEIECQDTFLLLPSDDTLDQLGEWPSFVTTHLTDLESDERTDYATFGSPAQIHVSNDHIYLAQGLRLPSRQRSCPVDASCIMPRIRGGQQNTLIHGFDRDGIMMDYIGSALVEGSPLHDQYSMDEYNGSFRILTQVRHPNQNTHLRVLDENLELQGSLMNIQKDERFQGSRYIGDKLYLITFEQIDPLFVIDLADETDPTILGELKMPGRSNYLHPYGPETDGVQYLIGIGYDAGQNQRGGTVAQGVKIDLYKVDYNQNETADSLCGSLADEDDEVYQSCLDDIETDRIRVERADSLTFGGAQSYTPVANNPRLFVFHPTSGQLTLPLLEKNQTRSIKRCTVVYENDRIIEEEEHCRFDEQYETTFAGYKVIDIDTDADDMLQVIYERDLQSLLLENIEYNYNDQLQGWHLDQLGMRVAFAGDAQLLFTNYFLDAVVPNISERALPLRLP